MCGCGFVAKGSVREANMKMKLHAKRCELTGNVNDMVNSSFNSQTNGLNGLRTTRNGNLTHQASIATGSSGSVDGVGLTEEEQRTLVSLLQQLVQGQ